MNSDELEQLRQQAIEDDKAFGVTRLKDEYRMKPKPDAKPTAWVKSPYNRNKNPVYLVADCVPIREIKRKPPTRKQLLAREISGIKAKLRSEANQTSIAINDLLTKSDGLELVYLDTETTGLDWGDQIIELAILSQAGEILFDERFKPTIEVSQGAFDVHGITDNDLKNCNTWVDRVAEIERILTGKLVVIFNSDFDLMLIRSTSDAFNLDKGWIEKIKTRCAMDIAASYFGSTNRYGTISLSDAAAMAGVSWKGSAHSAETDCWATKDLVNKIGSYCQPLLDKLAALEEEKKEL